MLGIWGHHDTVTGICRDALGPGAGLDPAVRADLEAELFANAITERRGGQEDAGPGRAPAGRPRLRSTGRWRVVTALASISQAQPAATALDQLAPVLAAGLRDLPPDSLTTAYSLMVLIWAEDLVTAGRICGTCCTRPGSAGR